MSVFSGERTIVSPAIAVDGMSLDSRQYMDGRTLLSRLPNQCTPLVFFDPQYRQVLDRQSYGNEGVRQQGRALLSQMTDKTIKEFMQEIERVLTPSGHLMLWVDKYILCSCLNSLINESHLHIVDMITWNKKRIGMGYRTRRCSEHIVVLQRPPIRAKGVWQAHNIPDVWDEKISKRTHAHEKPIELQKCLIQATTCMGDLVVDPAAGSYSVLLAALSTGRHFIGCDVAGDDDGNN